MQVLEDDNIIREYKEKICREFFKLEDPNLILLIEEKSRVVRFKSGEYVFREGDCITEIPILVKGIMASYSYCKDGTEMLNCICCETNIALDSGFDLMNPISMDDIKVIEMSDVVMLPVETIRKAYGSSAEARGKITIFYQKYLQYQTTFAKSRSMPIDERVDRMISFVPGLWNRVPEKCKAQMLNVAPEHWARYKKQHKL